MANSKGINRREFIRRMAMGGLAVGAASALGLSLTGCTQRRLGKKIFVLGFDGLSPYLMEPWMAEGKLPNFDKLRKAGGYARNMSTIPPESPVAWSSFAIGGNPGRHGIYDFLRCYMSTHRPEMAQISRINPKFFADTIPIRPPILHNNRAGTAFWTAAARAGYPVCVFQAPVTVPPDPVPGGHLLVGLGMPDIRSTQGTYHFFAEDAAEKELGSSEMGGIINRLRLMGKRAVSFVEGPINFLSNQFTHVALPVDFEISGDSVIINFSGEKQSVKEGTWSDWFTARFPMTSLVDIVGIGRFHVHSIKPLRIYLSPLDFHPSYCPIPLSEPRGWSAELKEKLGLYRTRGWETDTMAHAEERLTDSQYLEDVFFTEEMRRTIVNHCADNINADLYVSVFSATDRIQHVMWRHIDPKSPRYDPVQAAQNGDAILRIYQFADKVVGEHLNRLGKDDVLMVLSDHGFHPFRRGVNLNTWLVREGYMMLKGQSTENYNLDDLFSGQGKFFDSVDWSRTRAYALGLGQIYLNMQKNGPEGVVADADHDQLCDEIIAKMKDYVDPVTGIKPLRSAFRGNQIYRGAREALAPDMVMGYEDGYRVSWQTSLGGIPKDVCEDNMKLWSADHCSLDAGITKGVFFANRPLAGDIAIVDIAPTVLRMMGVEPPEPVDGKPIWD